jgi:hypothetical protein
MNGILRNAILNKIALLMAAVLLLIASTAFAQDAVPVEILQRTLLSGTGPNKGQGSLWIIEASFT